MVPFIYNFRSVRVRWTSNFAAIVGIAGVVSIFVAMLSMAYGFQATLVESGSPKNVMIRRAGATSEMDSIVTLDQLRVISSISGIAQASEGQALISPEVVVVAAFHHKASNSDALAQVRGVSPLALEIHDKVKIIEGRFFKPGLPELVVGKHAQDIYTGLSLGATPRFGGQVWKVVGVMDSKGSSFDSEMWCDQVVLNQIYKRPENLFSSLTLRLISPSEFSNFKDALSADPRLSVQIEKESDYYAKQSRVVSSMIKVLGYLVAIVMGIGAIFGAFNTMYSALTARSREIATLRAIGFGRGAVIMSMIFESVLIALIGGVLGCVIVIPMNGFTTSTLNWQTWSQMAFAFRITPGLLLSGISFSVLIGFLGGLIPALRAANLQIAVALREL